MGVESGGVFPGQVRPSQGQRSVRLPADRSRPLSLSSSPSWVVPRWGLRVSTGVRPGLSSGSLPSLSGSAIRPRAGVAGCHGTPNAVQTHATSCWSSRDQRTQARGGGWLAVIHRGARWPGWAGAGVGRRWVGARLARCGICGCRWCGLGTEQVSSSGAVGWAGKRKSRLGACLLGCKAAVLAWLGCPVGTGTLPVSRVSGSQLRVQQPDDAGQHGERQGSPKIQKLGGREAHSFGCWLGKRGALSGQFCQWPASGAAREAQAGLGLGIKMGLGPLGCSLPSAALLELAHWICVAEMPVAGCRRLCESWRLEGVTTRPLMAMVFLRWKGDRSRSKEHGCSRSVPAGMETGGPAPGREKMETGTVGSETARERRRHAHQLVAQMNKSRDSTTANKGNLVYLGYSRQPASACSHRTTGKLGSNLEALWTHPRPDDCGCQIMETKDCCSVDLACSKRQRLVEAQKRHDAGDGYSALG